MCHAPFVKVYLIKPNTTCGTDINEISLIIHTRLIVITSNTRNDSTPTEVEYQP